MAQVVCWQFEEAMVLEASFYPILGSMPLGVEHICGNLGQFGVTLSLLNKTYSSLLYLLPSLIRVS